ncbi:MAG TPA: hypothetical protein VI409_06865 [Gaiellaceae bacterium]|nr:hypothetical protein [Gaiellaceae bacterium]
MARRRRRLTNHYPPLDALGRTLRSKRASLTGARRFYAGEGMFVFADTKDGLANYAADVYLPPSAYHQLGNFLDQNATPAVVGWRLSALPTGRAQLPALAQTPLAQFTAGAMQTLQRELYEEERKITLQSGGDSDTHGWPWQATLRYETDFTLDGGVRIYDEATVCLFARETSDGDIDVAVVITQHSDREAAEAWLNRINRGRWLMQATVMPTTDPGRLETVRTVLDVFGKDRFIGLRSPDIYPVAGTVKKTRFAEAMERAPYQTKVTDLDVVVERMQQVDEGFLGTFTAFLWERGHRAVTSFELRQRPHESYARLAWRAGKAHDDSNLSFSDDWWEKATPVDWSPEQKQGYLLALWDEVLAGIDAIWARAVAARAADA